MTIKIYDGKLITVELDGRYEIVRHPPAVAIVALDAEGWIWLIRQHRVAAGTDLLEIPAGLREPGEAPLDAAARELEEEVGIRAGTYVHLAGFHTSPGFTDEWLDVYLATGLTVIPAGSRRRDDMEQIDELVQVPLAEAVAMIRSGGIRDAKSLAGILLTQLMTGPAPG